VLHVREPAEIVEGIERESELPPGSEERFSGYGVMGLPFRSGHVLGLRRIPASDVDEVREGPIQIDWTGPRRFRVRAGDGDLDWTVEVGSTPVTRLFNGVWVATEARRPCAASSWGR
jgi:hypothetical protein